MPAVTVLVRVLCWLVFWRCWCFRWRGCRWRWFWVRLGGGPDRLGAVVGQCWVAFCVGLLLVRVSHVLVFWWVLGSLVLPMVPPLVSGVSAGEGVVASGLGVGGGAGVGVVVPGPGVGRVRSVVTGCGRSPLLATGLVGPPLRPSGFWRPCSPPGGGGLLGSCCLGLCVLRVWCGRRLRFGVWCALVGLVSVAVVGVCVVCTLGRVCGVLVVRLGPCPRICGRGLAALFGVGAVCVPPPPVSAVWFPAPLGWGLLVVCPLAVPFACPPPSVSFPCRLGRCFSGVVPGPSRLWWVGGGPCRRLGSLPLVFPRGGAVACTPRQGVTLLYGPSICTRSVQMDLLRSQVLQPFPTPGSGTLWVAGESLRDRRVSCLPRWTVCPTRSPSLGPNRSTCRGECSWSGPLVTPPGRCHCGPLTNGPGRIPPYCVCSGGADTVTGGAPKPLRLGPSPASPVGPFRPAPLFAVRFAVVGVPSLRGGVVVVGGGGFSLFLAVLLACVSPPPLVVVRRRCVCLWRGACARGVCVGVRCVVCGVWCAVVVCWWGCGGCVVWLVPRHSWRRFLCATPRHSWLGFAACGGVRFPATPGWGSAAGSGVWCVVCGVWCVVSGGGVLVGLWLVCGAVGPSPLLAEVPVCYSSPLLVGFRCRWWWAVLATSG